VTSEPDAAAALGPDESGAALAARLLDELDADRSGPLAAFARAFARRAPAALVSGLDPADLAARVEQLYRLLAERRADELVVRVGPPACADGHSPTATVVDVCAQDAPFLVDTVTGELLRHGLAVRFVVHPVLGVQRAADGSIAEVTPARGAPNRESVMQFEVDRLLDDEQAAALAADVEAALSDLLLAVRDFLPMVGAVERMIEAALAASAVHPPDEIHEATEFLQWLTDDNFVYLGFREYMVEGEGDDAVATVVPGSGLGVMSDDARSSMATPTPLAELPEVVRERVEGGDLLVVSKTNRETTIHRTAQMDDIAVRRVDANGRMVGELRLIGLFTSKAYAEPAAQVPVIRRKLEAIMRWEDLFPGSHDFKAVVALFDSFPKDELFAASAADLRHTIMALLDMAEQGATGDRRGVRVFLLPATGGRSITAVLALRRDHLSADLQVRLSRLLKRRFRADRIDEHVAFDADPVRLHYTAHLPLGRALPDVDLERLERDVSTLARTWDDRLTDALVAEFGPGPGRRLARRYRHLLPDYYKSASGIEAAAFDVAHFDQLGDERPFLIALQNEQGVAKPLTRLKLYKTGDKAALTDLLPLLEQLGLVVVEEVPTRLEGDEGQGRYLHDFGVLAADGAPLDLDRLGGLVADTVSAVWQGLAGSDWLNRLVVAGAMSWQQVSILRTYREYRQLLGATFTSRYQNDCLVRNWGIARTLVDMFAARFDPTGDPSTVEHLRSEVLDALESVTSLDDDRILRSYLEMIAATVRTNFYVRPYAGGPISIKLRCADVPAMPKPRPQWEIFVYSPAMAAVHLRGGPVARGGIRWSDRLEDYRTEILGLMKAQMVKNAVIVPVGAKGGFVLKRPPADRAELREEERRQYVEFMRGMLDITDNIVGGVVVHPAGVRVLDAEDPYLVVAADKGTAHLSDTANEVSAEYGFWLGDAFASGGSSGYDHKALGITAKGAWESVKRHFRELGIDVGLQPFTAVGVGDMSGDVFGNGMLLSSHLRLVAAFDHRHVFVDPNPPANAIDERRRLYDLPGSSWDDYDRSRISAGGGVWPRSAKSVPLSEQARAVLGVDHDRLTPTELIQAILRAPVDLLWNGGIGTYVKASSEDDADVGDRANDAVRVNGGDLRCRVVGEGGNLGCTQLGRVEYAGTGGRINTDAIDNSAGVDCSDHEVNLKILLGIARDAGELTAAGRDELLQDVAGHVVEHVLYDNYLQVQILSQEQAASVRRMEAYEDLMVELEQAGLLERAIEFLPSSEAMAERIGAGRGMARPELCVLLAYAKRLFRDQIRNAPLLDDPYLSTALAEYFPGPVVERFGAHLAAHPLRRELIATIITNDIVNSMGITFVPRMTAETGAGSDEVARAFLIARDVSQARDRWEDVERLDGVIDAEVQSPLMDGVDSLTEQLTRWYLQNPQELDLGAAVERDRGGYAEVINQMRLAATPAWRSSFESTEAALREQGVPERPAGFGAIVPELAFAPDVVAVARETGRSVPDVLRAFFIVGERLYLDVLAERVAALPSNTRWQRLAWTTTGDDLRLLRRQIVLRAIGESGDVDEAVDSYLAARVDPYQRLARLMETAATPTVDDPSLVMVVIHQIRQVAA
jgi:glutamate dehydrogenase